VSLQSPNGSAEEDFGGCAGKELRGGKREPSPEREGTWGEGSAKKNHSLLCPEKAEQRLAARKYRGFSRKGGMAWPKSTRPEKEFANNNKKAEKLHLRADKEGAMAKSSKKKRCQQYKQRYWGKSELGVTCKRK